MYAYVYAQLLSMRLSGSNGSCSNLQYPLAYCSKRRSATRREERALCELESAEILNAIPVIAKSAPSGSASAKPELCILRPDERVGTSPGLACLATFDFARIGCV